MEEINKIIDFEEYLKEEEPSKKQLAYAWYTAIGLQDVDGLETSPYLKELALKNIEGEIDLAKTRNILNNYYEEKDNKQLNSQNKEADFVSNRIAMLLCENSFSLTPNEYLGIHRKLFEDIYDHAGQAREFNITKKEWILNGESVTYGSASELLETLNYDLKEEKNFNYKGLTTEQIIKHLAHFIANLWQIHVFAEGNTRTTAVFFIKYLRTLGYDVTNDIFAKHAWYLRNALVRANYNDLKNNIHETTEYLELFLRNLLLNEDNELNNRSLRIEK